MPNEKNVDESQLSENELNLIAMIRRLGYGQIVITVQDGKPVRAEEVRKSVML